MKQVPSGFDDADGLIERLIHAERPVAFLVGSPLTMPVERNGPGVPGVDAMLGMIGDRFGATTGRWTARGRRLRFEGKLAEVPPGRRYQTAFEYLIQRNSGVDEANRVVRDAVLRARVDEWEGDAEEAAVLAGLEGDVAGWHLGPGVKALGQILAGVDRRFGRLVLTTNFDPLVEVAVRAAGGEAQTVVAVGEVPIDVSLARGTLVVHLHGFWRGETLHTPQQLTVDRVALRRSLARILDEYTLVVMAYGGWQDVIAATVADLAADVQSKPDVLWCFYGRDVDAIVAGWPALFDGRLRGRMVCYAGIDCHDVLPRLRAALDREGELLGRRGVCERLSDALERGHAVQVVGEPYMKRSNLLRWAAELAGRNELRPVYVNARALSRAEPEALVRAVAMGLGRYAEVERELARDRALPDVDDAIRCLSMIEGACVLIDDADALFERVHGFEVKFFEALRAMVQGKRLQWVSVSRRPVDAMFAETRSGRGSAFLNDALTVYAGGLDREETAQALAVRLGGRGAAALAAAGTLPHLVYRLVAAEWGDVEGAIAGLGAWADGLCALWWDRRAVEQGVLRQAVQGVAEGALGDVERRVAVELVKRGLMVEEAGGVFALNGGVWRAYVERVG